MSGAIVAPKEEKTAIGVAIMALAVLFFTGIDTSAKWLVTVAALPALQVVFVRYAVHFTVAFAIYFPREGLAVFRSNAPRKQALRAVCLFCSTVLNFFALTYLPISVTTTIFFAAPIVVTLAAIPLLGEQVGVRRVVAVCTGFLGVAVVVQPWGAAFHPAMFFGLGAMMIASMYFIMTRMLAGVDSNATSQIWAAGVATCVLAPVALPLWQWPETTLGYVVLGVIGLFGAFGHIAAVSAHRLADASLLAPVVYIQLLFASLAGYFVFATLPTRWTFVGGLIIIASGLYIWHRERLKTRHAKGGPPTRPGLEGN